ncbi:UDP-N-acetylmuramate dehydrogenase [Candidatus Roizmanbacteria bacterium]|nr:UDP-N-acetylmuramate dehydrogenase [Candidatus Roizmanbacteria bacterium]
MKLGDLKRNIDLFSHTTLRMKTVAEYFFEAKSRDDLILVRKLASNQRLPFTILGGGSNVAMVNAILRGIVVKNLYIQKELVSDSGDSVWLLVSSGYPGSKLVNETVEAGYQGLEYHLGLPGTVGGAIYMNSKWTNPECYFGDPVESAHLLDKAGNVKKVKKDYFHFAYDYSRLQETGEILLEVVFRFKKADPKVLKKRADEALTYRKATQPFGIASSGCFFRNIDGTSAGSLIDRAGLKGTRIGNFVVSPKHANFILNQGDGNPEDLKKLIELVKEKVKAKFGVELKEEVILL